MAIQITIFISVFIRLFFVLGLWLVVVHQKFKKTQKNRLQSLVIEVEKEKHQQENLKSVSQQIIGFESNTALKFRKVNLAIVTIDFSLREIF
ncbi:hypothetical protein DUT90_11165 [Polaribacter sp. WD7]|uniref:hypothetical protein n=1 Tax=Polaribacter sp. WD7 TaxID=2269061 RepID=UPI000DF13F45|nr:hypothetical protein [Polaribacter sp. WD7]RCS26323.1 hypothetical protein DUT90_11165 [Polaribacter sp. WD7]